MLRLSQDILTAWDEHKDITYSVSVTLADEEADPITITEDQMVTGGCNILRSSGSDVFPVGYVFGSQLTLTLYDEFDDVDFYMASVTVNASYTYDEDEEPLEITLGTYTITEPAQHGEVLELTGYDEIYKTDRQMILPDGALPMTATALFASCCTLCGLNFYAGWSHDGLSAVPSGWTTSTIQVTEMPSGLTYRQIMGMVAMLFGANVFVSPFDGYVYVVPVKTLQLDNNIDLPDPLNPPTIPSINITIGGVKITCGSETKTYGSGYLLALENQLITGIEQDCANMIGAYLAGMTFRPFEINYSSFPFAELMQWVNFEDFKGNEYTAPLTHIDLPLKGVTVMKCAARTPTRNESNYNDVYSKMNTALEQALETIEIPGADAFNDSMFRLSRLMANSLGMYSTTQTDSNGRKIFYFHDKSTLQTSQIIWRYNANGFTVSTDGGVTYNAGMDASGNAVVNMLSAIGISANWVRTGAIVSNDGRSSWDLSDGVFINYDSVTETSITLRRGEIGFHGDIVTPNSYYDTRFGYINVDPDDYEVYIDGELRTFDDGAVNFFAPNLLIGIQEKISNSEYRYYHTLILNKVTDAEVLQNNKYRLEIIGPTLIKGNIRLHDGNASSVIYMPEIGIMNGLAEYSGSSAVSPAVYAQDVFCVAAKRIWIGNTLNQTDVTKGIAGAQPQQNYYCTVTGSMRVVGNFRCYGFIGNNSNVTITKDTTLLSGGSRHNLSGIETCSANLFSGGGVSVSGTVDCNLIQYYQTFQKSDSRLKDIKEWDERYDGLISELHPILYSWKTGNNEIIVGLSAQEVKDALKKHGIDDSGIVREYQGEYSLDYTSINMLLMKHVQDQEQEIKTLKNRVEELETALNKIMERLGM